MILAVQRQGDDTGPGETVLAEGDTLLLQGTWAALDAQPRRPRGARRRPAGARAPPGRAARRRARSGRSPCSPAMVVAARHRRRARRRSPGLLAACALILLGVLTVEQAQRGISWTTVVLVGGMISLSTAMVASGAAEQLADRLVDVVGDAGPHALLLGLFLLTAVLGQLISNMATALIVIPIAISAAAEMDVSAKPVLMAVTVSAAASFLTPVATPGEPDGHGARAATASATTGSSACRCSRCSASSPCCSSRSSGPSRARAARSTACAPRRARRRAAACADAAYMRGEREVVGHAAAAVDLDRAVDDLQRDAAARRP